MRKSVFFILLATAAMPALAAAPDPMTAAAIVAAARAERSERGDGDNPQRSQRAERSEPHNSGQSVQRVERSERAEVAAAPEPAAQRVAAGRARVGPGTAIRAPWPQSAAARATAVDRRAAAHATAADRQRRIAARQQRKRDQLAGARAPLPRGRPVAVGRATNDDARSGRRQSSVDDRRDRIGDGATVDDRNPADHWATATAMTGRRWSGDWRRDNRYNWRSHRSRYSSLFRLGRYHDPFGYGYRRFSIGLDLGIGLLRKQLLAQRSVAVPPAAGLRPVPLGPLLQRCAAGEYLQRPSGRRDLRLLLVDGRSAVGRKGRCGLAAAPLVVVTGEYSNSLMGQRHDFEQICAAWLGQRFWSH